MKLENPMKWTAKSNCVIMAITSVRRSLIVLAITTTLIHDSQKSKHMAK